MKNKKWSDAKPRVIRGVLSLSPNGERKGGSEKECRRRQFFQSEVKSRWYFQRRGYIY